MAAPLNKLTDGQKNFILKMYRGAYGDSAWSTSHIASHYRVSEKEVMKVLRNAGIEVTPG